MTPTTNVFNDPQGSMAVLLRPPDGFETLYQGAAFSTPLPFVAGTPTGNTTQFLPKDPGAGNNDLAARLLRYVSVPIGATMMLVIPRAEYVTGGETPAEGIYTYELRWRLRTVTDHNVAQELRGDPTVPYTVIPRRGAPDDAFTHLTVIPAYTSETIVPSAPGNGNLPIIDTAANPRGIANQGTFIPATVGGFGLAFAPNAYFNPILRRVIGNDLSVVAYRTTGATTWDFQADDGGISNVYGTNQVTGGTPHPVFLGVGMYLIFLAGSPAL